MVLVEIMKMRDDSSFDDYLKDSGISKSTDNEEVDKDVVDMSDAELDDI
jgi:hypothetical protein